MNAQSAFKRRLGIGLVAVLSASLTSACATGQLAQTANQVAAIDGTSAQVGSLRLLDVAIKAPPKGPGYGPGGTAQLQLVVVNVGHDKDTLQGITSPAAARFDVFVNSAEADAAAPSGSGSASAAPSGSTSASGSAATVSATSSLAPSAPISLDVLAGRSLSLGVTDAGAVLVLHLTKTLFPGTSVPITFTFANAGAVTISVPVKISSGASAPGISVAAPSSDGPS